MLNARSITALEGVHPELQRVIYRAAELYTGQFVVTEGERTLDKQKALLAKGASKTLRSRHVPEMNQCGVACAVDLAVWMDLDGDDVVDGGEIRWDWPLYVDLAGVVKEAAAIEGIPVEWGGDWLKFKDGPHFQLPWKAYP